MTDRPARVDLRSLLARAEATAPVDAVEAVADALVEMLGAREVSFLIVDFSGLSLRRLGHTVAAAARGGRSRETSERVELLDTPHGAALRSQEAVLLREEDGDVRVLAPVTSRGEAVGLLELVLPFDPAPVTVEDIELAAHQLAYIVIANRRYTDLYEWGQRTVPLSLAAEIQRRLLPSSFTCEAGQFTLAGWLEPAAEVSGDTFDFSLDRDTLHVSMTDAMGHSVASALLATILVGSLRNTRRRGASLSEQAEDAHTALETHAADAGFVTGQLLRVDLLRRSATIVNAGHPLPFRVRGGRAERIPLLADPPFGALADDGWRVQELPLQVGDRLVFLTDGMLERNAGSLDIQGMLEDSHELHPRDAIQHLIHAVLEASQGRLQDDAAALCIDWLGGPRRDRVTHAGGQVDPDPADPVTADAEPGPG
ncbi:MAG: serine/threonine-protein phosphatase [Solirubrobacterales bacterium]|nr:serine/threonine-protein phosphatase [Solirubrobacterales bacterium]